MSAVLSLPGPAALSSSQRRLPLALALMLHGALILSLLNGLQPDNVDVTTPREVVISLIPQRTQQAVEQRVSRLPEPVTRPLPAAKPAPQPVAQTAVAPAAAPAITPSATPLPRTAPTETPTTQAAASATATPAAEPRTAAAHPASPPPATPAPAERTPVMVSSVEYLQAPKPDYPISAKRAGEQGKVVLRVLVDDKGHPERVDVRESAGFSKLDEAARQAVMRASFKPHLEDGRPVPVYVLVPINFALR